VNFGAYVLDECFVAIAEGRVIHFPSPNQNTKPAVTVSRVLKDRFEGDAEKCRVFLLERLEKYLGGGVK
jgi:hypothetical protein